MYKGSERLEQIEMEIRIIMHKNKMLKTVSLSNLRLSLGNGEEYNMCDQSIQSLIIYRFHVLIFKLNFVHDI